MRLHYNNGFTLIEVLIVSTIIVIATSVTTVTYLNVQKDSRDTKKLASATSLAESLERFFERNGEYPPVASVTDPNAVTVKQMLDVPTLNSLLHPNAPSGSSVNVWKTGTTSTTNQFTYTPNTDTSDSCRTLSSSTDACMDYKIQFYKEKTGTVETIYSRYKAVVATTPPPAAPITPIVSQPDMPTITATLSGSNAVGTRSNVSCTSPATAQYAFRSRSNDGAWSTYTAWNGTTASTSVPANQGGKYDFQVKARCIDGATSSSEAISSEAVYIRPVTTPAAPTVAQATTSTTTTFSVSAVTCATGTTAEVQYKLATDWGYVGDWTMPRPSTDTHIINTESEGYEYSEEAQVRCKSNYATSAWSASGTTSYIRPVTTPGGAPSYTVVMSAGATDLVWTVIKPACHSSVVPGLYYNYYVGNGWTYNGASGWTGWRHVIVTNGGSVNIRIFPTGSAQFTAGGTAAVATEWYCINQTTGRKSSIGPRVQTPLYTYNP